MKQIVIVFGSGGHQKQMTLLANKLKMKFEIVGVLCQEDFVAEHLKEYRHYYVKRPRDAGKNYLTQLLIASYAFLKSIEIMFKERPVAVISCGPSHAVPVMYAGKLFGSKIIFIESWSKITTKSLTGKLIHPISNLFLVQWEEMLALYKDGIYRGRFHD